jgi:hypothetical protein
VDFDKAGFSRVKAVKPALEEKTFMAYCQKHENEYDMMEIINRLC